MMLPIANAVLQQLCENEANAEERDHNTAAAAAATDGQDNQAFEMGDTKGSKLKAIDMGTGDFNFFFYILKRIISSFFGSCFLFIYLFTVVALIILQIKMTTKT